MTRFPIAMLALAPVLLGGCQKMFDVVGVEQPLSALEARNFDGSYQGNITQDASNAAVCPIEHGEKVIMVGDGVLWYAYAPGVLFTPPVRYDGSIAGTSGAATIAGNVDGNHLAMTIKSPNCQTSVSMDYIGNHS